MIASISARNRSRRVFFPLFCHASPANVCCFATLVSTNQRCPSIDENYVFHSIARRRLVQRFPSTVWKASLECHVPPEFLRLLRGAEVMLQRHALLSLQINY